MEELYVRNIKVGQLAEMKSFDRGFRGAWFRGKIRDIFLKKNKVQMEYYDFEEEEISMAKLYEAPHYGRKSKTIKKQLMMRPHYPPIIRKSEMPPVNSISEVCVIHDGTWNVGDLVDWFEDSCYWSARVIKVLSDDKVQIELPMAPAGEGGTHEALCKNLRPSLDWSAEKGWTLATMEGQQNSSSAQLIFPSQQDEVDCMDYEVENDAAGGGGEVSAISATAIEGDRMNSEKVKMDDGKGMDHEVENAAAAAGGGGEVSAISATAIGDKMNSEEVKMDDGKGMEDEVENAAAGGGEVSSISATPIEGDRMNSEEVKMDDRMNSEVKMDDRMNSEEVKMDDRMNTEVKMDYGKGGASTTTSSEDSTSTLHVEETKEDDVVGGNNIINLNMMHEETLEATIMDLEELVNRVKWIKNILETNQDSTTSSSSSVAASDWKFAD